MGFLQYFLTTIQTRLGFPKSKNSKSLVYTKGENFSLNHYPLSSFCLISSFLPHCTSTCGRYCPSPSEAPTLPPLLSTPSRPKPPRRLSYPQYHLYPPTTTGKPTFSMHLALCRALYIGCVEKSSFCIAFLTAHDKESLSCILFFGARQKIFVVRHCQCFGPATYQGEYPR
jgi:hypothetical protein